LAAVRLGGVVPASPGGLWCGGAAVGCGATRLCRWPAAPTQPRSGPFGAHLGWGGLAVLHGGGAPWGWM
jgi:hypothetical protein